MSRSAAALDLTLHPKQGAALNSPATEILYGGAAGGGKSHLMRVAAIIWCSMIPGLQCYFFRRIRDDLIKNHMEGPKGFRSMLAPWALAGFCIIVEDEIRFWNGSKIYLCHCKDEKDVYKYQGAEIHVLLIDEITHFTQAMYRFLRNRVRMVGITLPKDYQGRFPRIMCGGNPGNIGHLWVKATWVDGHEYMTIRQQPANEGGMLRQYIPAKLEDNPSMAQDDPGYEQRLEGLGSAALVRAMRHGDWDVVEGAFFDCWDAQRHIIKPRDLPGHWTRFRAMDWGSYRPFSVGWYAVSDGEMPEFPAGALIRYREWYGMKDGEPNVGLKLFAGPVARGIVERTPEKIDYDVCDPAMWISNGGPSIAEQMATETGWKLNWRAGDNKRQAGWDQCRGRLIGIDDRPMFYVFSNCVHFIRTIPALQHDDVKAEDLDTDGEDHAADEWRYACMSRPWTRPQAQQHPNQNNPMAFANLVARSRAKRLAQEE